MNNVVYDSLVKLCTDICKRNGKKKLLWLADKNKTLNYTPKSDEMVLTVHRWFANKSCPGNWLYARLGDLAAKVTANVFNPSKQEEYFAWMIDKCDELSNALVQVGEMDEEPKEKDKFSKLKQYLENCGKTELTLTFTDIETIIGCNLCKSAYNYSAYWTPSPTHTMPNTILAAGFKVVSVDLLSNSLLLHKQ